MGKIALIFLICGVVACVVAFTIWMFRLPHVKMARISRVTVRKNPMKRGDVYLCTFGQGFNFEKTCREMAAKANQWTWIKDAKCFSVNDLDEQFRQKFSWLLSKPRGAGYWIWKPHVCQKTWDAMKEGDVLIYVDGALQPRKDLLSYVDRACCSESGGLVFEQRETQGQQTKGDGYANEGMGRQVSVLCLVLSFAKKIKQFSFFPRMVVLHVDPWTY